MIDSPWVLFRSFNQEDRNIMPKPYDQDFKDRALRMLTEALPERGSVHAASKHVGGLLGISPDTLRIW